MSWLRAGKSRYPEEMATRFIQQSEEYIRQIDAEMERLQQLRDQVQSTIQSEAALEGSDPTVKTPRKRAAKKAASKQMPAKKRGRPKANVATEA